MEEGADGLVFWPAALGSSFLKHKSTKTRKRPVTKLNTVDPFDCACAAELFSLISP